MSETDEGENLKLGEEIKYKEMKAKNARMWCENYGNTISAQLLTSLKRIHMIFRNSMWPTCSSRWETPRGREFGYWSEARTTACRIPH